MVIAKEKAFVGIASKFMAEITFTIPILEGASDYRIKKAFGFNWNVRLESSIGKIILILN